VSKEFWLDGPVAEVPPLLQPAAHALLQSGYDLRRAAESLSPEETWHRPGGAASVGFHLRHLAGSLDRLFTYALGQPLSEAQREYLSNEKIDPVAVVPVESLLAHVDATIERALGILREIPEASLLEPRMVGRAQRPSTVLGLLFHAAEHTQRHTGQVVTTAKIVGPS
jgi:uncharacterized damage-inducible protein DinB